MPAHGRPVHLAEAVGSVLAQSHASLRLLVLDDSGGEEIGEALTPFLSDRRLEHRRSEPLSATQAMTRLMQAGEAPFFAFLHDDDRWGPGFLARRVAFLESHPRCGFVISGHVDIGSDGRETARAPAPFPEGEVARETLVPLMQQRNVVDVMHCVLARRSALEEAGVHLDDAFPRLFDWELWLRMSLRTTAGCVDVEDAEYRAHEDQMSSQPGAAVHFRELVEHADRLTAEQAPELRLAPALRRRLRARLELSLAFDRLQAEQPASALAALRRGARLELRALLTDRRAPAALLGLVVGRRGRRAVAGLRAGAYRRSRARRL